VQQDPILVLGVIGLGITSVICLRSTNVALLARLEATQLIHTTGSSGKAATEAAVMPGNEIIPSIPAPKRFSSAVAPSKEVRACLELLHGELIT